MKRKKREKGESTLPENVGYFLQLVDWDDEKDTPPMAFTDGAEEEKKDEWEWAWPLGDEDFNSSSAKPSAYYDDLSLQMALFHSTHSFSSSTTITQDTSKKNAHDVKRKGICTGPVPLRTFDPGISTQEWGEPSCTYCVICDDAKPTSSLVQSECLHYFCRDCIEIYLREKIQENILPVKCPENDCKASLEATFWRHYVPKEVFDRREKACLESRALAFPNMIECPGCFNMFADDGRDFLIKACPKCWKIFCMKCRVPWHMGLSCQNFQFQVGLLQRFWNPHLILLPFDFQYDHKF